MTPEKDAVVDAVLLLRKIFEKKKMSVITWPLSFNERLVDNSIPSSGNLPNLDQIYEFPDVPEETLDPELIEKWRGRLAGVLRYDFPDADLDTVWKKVLQTSFHIVEILKPDIFICWSPLVVHFGLAAEFVKKRGGQVVCFEWGLLPNTLLMDKGGLYGFSELTLLPLEELVDEKLVLNYKESGAFELQRLKHLVTQNNVNSDTLGKGEFWRHNKRDKKRLLCLGTNDRGAGYYPESGVDRKKNLPGFKTSFEAACGIAGTGIGETVFKPHPGMDKEIYDLEETSLKVILKGDVFSLIKEADVIISLGTNLDYYALAIGKPVVSLVKNPLSNKGIVFEAYENQMIAGAINEALASGFTTDQERRYHQFLGYLTRDYLIPLCNSVEAQRILELRVNSILKKDEKTLIESEKPDFRKFFEKLTPHQRLIWEYKRKDLAKPDGFINDYGLLLSNLKKPDCRSVQVCDTSLINYQNVLDLQIRLIPWSRVAFRWLHNSSILNSKNLYLFLTIRRLLILFLRLGNPSKRISAFLSEDKFLEFVDQKLLNALPDGTKTEFRKTRYSPFLEGIKNKLLERYPSKFRPTSDGVTPNMLIGGPGIFMEPSGASRQFWYLPH